MDKRNVVVVVTAEDCPACTQFKTSTWPALRDQLGESKSSPVELWHLNKKQRAGPIPDNYPKDIQRFIGWFPTLLLFTRESWNSKGPLVGSIYHGFFDENGTPKLDSNPDFSAQKILDWVTANHKSEMIQTKSVRREPKQVKFDSKFEESEYVPAAGRRNRYPYGERR